MLSPTWVTRATQSTCSSWHCHLLERSAAVHIRGQIPGLLPCRRVLRTPQTQKLTTLLGQTELRVGDVILCGLRVMPTGMSVHEPKLPVHRAAR